MPHSGLEVALDITLDYLLVACPVYEFDNYTMHMPEKGYGVYSERPERSHFTHKQLEGTYAWAADSTCNEQRKQIWILRLAAEQRALKYVHPLAES